MPRWDSLPENKVYADDGCDMAPACLTCPLPRCKYDMAPGALIALRKGDRNARVRGMQGAGYSAEAIAAELGMSARNVHRVLSGR